MASPSAPSASVLSPSDLLAHWQGHRRLTRRVIDAFPADQLFTFSIGGMRPFGALAGEMLAMAAPMARGAATDDWGTYTPAAAESKDELLRLWDEATEQIDAVWPRLSAERFQETATAFGMYTSKVYDLFLYSIDNEVHHRGQGYVYLRALGIEPPAFWVRD
jgi:uncharacterized damage-inducible protein DinB